MLHFAGSYINSPQSNSSCKPYLQTMTDLLANKNNSNKHNRSDSSNSELSFHISRNEQFCVAVSHSKNLMVFDQDNYSSIAIADIQSDDDQFYNLFKNNIPNQPKNLTNQNTHHFYQAVSLNPKLQSNPYIAIYYSENENSFCLFSDAKNLVKVYFFVDQNNRLFFASSPELLAKLLEKELKLSPETIFYKILLSNQPISQSDFDSISILPIGEILIRDEEGYIYNNGIFDSYEWFDCLHLEDLADKFINQNSFSDLLNRNFISNNQFKIENNVIPIICPDTNTLNFFLEFLLLNPVSNYKFELVTVAEKTQTMVDLIPGNVKISKTNLTLQDNSLENWSKSAFTSYSTNLKSFIYYLIYQNIRDLYPQIFTIDSLLDIFKAKKQYTMLENSSSISLLGYFKLKIRSFFASILGSVKENSNSNKLISFTAGLNEPLATQYLYYISTFRYSDLNRLFTESYLKTNIDSAESLFYNQFYELPADNTGIAFKNFEFKTKSMVNSFSHQQPIFDIGLDFIFYMQNLNSKLDFNIKNDTDDDEFGLNVWQKYKDYLISHFKNSLLVQNKILQETALVAIFNDMLTGNDNHIDKILTMQAMETVLGNI